jgi:peroxiredoxin
MKKTAVFLLALFFSVTAFALSGVPATSKSTDFVLNDLRGKPVSFNSYKGKALLLVFFRTECPACQQELPQLEPLYKKYRSKNFDVLAVSIKEDAYIVRSFARENKLSFTVLLDDDGALAAAYKVRFIPRLFVVDRSGNIKFSSYAVPVEDIEKEIKKILK